MRLLLATALVLSAASPAFAQQEKPEPPKEKPAPVRREVHAPVEHHDLDGAIIEGTFAKPMIGFINVDGRVEFEKIIPERAHFRNELRRSVRDLNE